MRAKVGIVLVNYNGLKFQQQCLDTLKKISYDNYEIIVVDNGSTDGSVEVVKENFKDVVILETGKNNGFARGCNIGIKYAIDNACEYILLLNNDTEVDKEFLSNMMDVAEKDSKNIVTCKMYYYNPSDIIWSAGGAIKWNKGITYHFGEDKPDTYETEKGKYVEFTPGCCILAYKDAFKDIGYLDEKYFMYYEDTDFCVRAKLNNYKIWYEPTSKLYHKVSSSSGGEYSKLSVYYQNRNRLYFINKHIRNKFYPLAYFYLTRFIKCIQYIIKGRIDLIKVTYKAVKDYYKGNMDLQEL